jgi:radical SAM protein with 4Fe4S-binding SPASM domain
MSLSQFRHIAQDIKPHTNQVSLHLLGEPLSHPQLGPILDAASEAGLAVNIVTNGVLQTAFAHMLHPAVRQVSFSLQSYLDNFQSQDPRRYLERIKNFCEQALAERPDLYLNLRLWDLDGGEGPDASKVLGPYKDLLMELFNFDWSDLNIDVKRRKSHRLKGRLYLHFDSRFSWPDATAPAIQEKGTCRALSHHCGILTDGTVVPCCLDHQGAINLGNIYEKALAEILESPRAQDMLNGFKAGRLAESLCKTCGYIKRFG